LPFFGFFFPLRAPPPPAGKLRVFVLRSAVCPAARHLRPSFFPKSPDSPFDATQGLCYYVFRSTYYAGAYTNAWITQLRKGLLELCILNLLSRADNYGYEIVQELHKVEELAVTESTIYPILARLTKDGFLKVRVVPSPQGPPRRYFALTVLGRHRVREMNDYWEELNASIKRLRNSSLKGRDNV